MLLFQILSSKPQFTKKNGDVVIDLSKSTFVPSPISDAQPYIVNSDFCMRPDLVSNAIYSDQNQLDVLLKFNGISNPFSINTGDILYAPSIESIKTSIQPSATIIDKGSAQNNNSVLTPKTTQDSRRLQLLSTNSTPIPNNVNQPSDTNISISNGKVVFGADVTSVTTDKCKDTVTRAKLKEKLLANKIFNNN